MKKKLVITAEVEIDDETNEEYLKALLKNSVISALDEYESEIRGIELTDDLTQKERK